MKRTPLVIILLLILAGLSTEHAGADIYFYEDEAGVACFTDAPKTSEAVLVIKEKNARDRQTKRLGPPALAATGVNTNPKKEVTTDSIAFASRLPINGIITSGSGLRHDPIDGTMRMHNGVDIAAPQGTPIKPVLAGTVIFSGTRPGYGNMVMLEHADGTLTLYAHNLLNVKSAGEHAEPGDTIALLGSTGRSTGPHLHFEAWRDGINITSSFTGTSAAGTHNGEDADPIRMRISPDGSLLLTNLN